MLKHKSILFTIVISISICFFLTEHFSWKETDANGNINVIESDGKGYYLYLPNIFINKNIANQKIDNRFILKTENGSINKYYIGTAVAIMPFFSVAYFSAYLWKEPLDGYSKIFQKSINFAALFYLALGLYFCSSLLLLYRIKPLIICITIVLILFGTNLLMYATVHPSFSHIYSFCFVNLFLFATKKIILSYNFKYSILMSFALGMIIIIRPINGLIIFIVPFLAGSFTSFKSTFLNLFYYKNLLSIIIVIVSVISIQLYVWYIQTGSIINWSYQNEGFYFLKPQIINFLFSFRKGLFIYTPLLLLSSVGLFVIYKQNKYEFYTVSLFLSFIVYVTSSWWCWYYGPSFGQRTLVDFYCLFALLLAILFNHFYSSKFIFVSIFLATLFSLLNLIQSYQYRKHIISTWDMSYEKYKYVFLQTSEKYEWNLGGCNDIKPYHKKEKLILNLNNDFDNFNHFGNKTLLKDFDYKHKKVSDYSNKEYNGTIEIETNEIMLKHRMFFAEIELDRLELEPSEKLSPILVITITDSVGVNYFYYSFPINDIPNSIKNEWKTQKYSIEIPKITSIKDKLQFYIWNKNFKPFYLDNFKLNLTGID